jgi:L-methionine (R)-S-oxide reductase
VDATLLEQVATVVAGLEPRAVRAQRAADVIRGATSARWVGIYSVTDTQVVNEAWSGPQPPAHPVFSVTEGLTSHAVRERRAVLSNDVGADPRYLTNQDDSGSELVVPVLVRGRVIGTLDVEHGRTGAFRRGDVLLYGHLAQALTSLW